MNHDIIKSKIDLLQEQIDNLEKSGFFTEKEMDRQTVSLRSEMCFLDFQIKSLESPDQKPSSSAASFDTINMLREVFQRLSKKAETEIYKRINIKEDKN